MQKVKNFRRKGHLNQVQILIASALLIAVNINAFPVKAQTQSDMDKLSVQLEGYVSTHNWSKAMNVIEKMIIMIPSNDYEQRITLKNYRAKLRFLYDSKVDPHFYPAEYIQNFMKGCLTSGGKQLTHVCTCMIDKIEDKYALEQFVQIALKYTTKAQIPDNIQKELSELEANCIYNE